MYRTYEPLRQNLLSLQEAFPHLMRLEAIGRSPEGREILAATVTSSLTGPAGEKPALLVDANIHAGEVTGSEAALYFLEYLLEGFGKDEGITRLLNTRSVYVIPRVSVDGAEWYLTQPLWLRSVPRLYPVPRLPEGFTPEDINGDGHILLMRVPSPVGEWAIAGEDPRMMRPREPGEYGGTYYRVLPEGYHRGTTRRPRGLEVSPQGLWGGPLKVAEDAYGLDLNRNFPVDWRPHPEERGAGPYPLSEPESRAVATFVVGRPNITVYISLHTSGRVLVHPPSAPGEQGVLAADRETFRRFDEVAEALLGFPVRSTFEVFHEDPKERAAIGSDDWVYRHRGILGFTLELWDLDGEAGVEGYGKRGIRGMELRSVSQVLQDERTRLSWNDRVLAGKGFTPWTPFDHPQLGPVEIGGWDPKFVVQNPPPPLLESECRRILPFLLRAGLSTPRLEWGRVAAKSLRPGVVQVVAEVGNSGFLGTRGTARAKELNLGEGLVAELALPAGTLVLAGENPQKGPELDGMCDLPPFGQASYGLVGNTAWFRWVLEVPAPAPVTLRVLHPRGGVLERDLWVGEEEDSVAR